MLTPTCDLCKEDGTQAVASYTITGAGKTVVVDACQDHAAPFYNALQKGSQGPRRNRPEGKAVPRPVTHAVVPVD